MPRRSTELVQLPEPPKKKTRVVPEQSPSLDVSFCDDEALPPGIVFTDLRQKKWRIGKPIGRGSFGRIYLASDDVDAEVTKSNARYVVKIEPHTNGPLFVEIYCLIRTANFSKVKEWRHQNKQKRLGMPIYIASGSFTDENTGVKYRFLVLPRYDIDLQKIISRTKVLDLKNVLILTLQILDILEYLHNHGYTHSDIKSSNLMLGFDEGKLRKFPSVKPAPSFEKERKEVTVLRGKYRRVKSNKSRSSNYYDDEDFIIKDCEMSNLDEETASDKRLASVKNKLRKILSDKDNRTLHRHHAFNLRQLSNYVNYEDLSSSVCSDQSYQKLLDDYGSKNTIYISDPENIQHSKKRNPREKLDNETDPGEIYKEAVLSQTNGQIYLLDYGLASKFVDSEGNHRNFSMDARKAHDGTLEYSSRDSHIGAHSRRSDLETLGYNLLDWLTGTLPWKTTEILAEPDLVHALKKKYMNDIKTLLKTCFKTEFYPQFMEKYLQYITNLDYTEKPDYDYCRRLFRSELHKTGFASEKELLLNFAEPPMSPMNRNKLCYSKRFGRKNTPSDFLARNGIKKSYERENVCSFENYIRLELLKQTINSSSDGIRKPCTSRNFFISDTDLVARLKKSLMPHDVFGKKLSPKNLRSNKNNIQKRRGKRTHRNNIGKFGNFMGSAKQFSWAEILARNPEDIIRKERNSTFVHITEQFDDDETCKYRIRKLSETNSESDSNLQSPLLQKDYLQGMNPTYAMKEIVANFKKRLAGKSTKETEDLPDDLKGYTSAMIKIYRMKEKREAKEKLEALKEQNTNKKDTIIQLTCRRSLRSNAVKNTKPSKQTTKKKASTEQEKNKILKVNKPTLRVTRSNASSEDSNNKRATNNDTVQTKTNVKTRNGKKVAIQTEVIIAESPKTTPVKSVKKTTRHKIVPVNRRSLRSSKRKK